MTTNCDEAREYLRGATVIAFDIETSPDDGWRHDPKAALDPHRSHIVGVSFSVCENDGLYMPLAHSTFYENTDMQDGISLLVKLCSDRTVVKVVHNLAFEAAFMYGLGIVIQMPVYDTIAAAQMVLKSKSAYRKLSDCGLKKLAPELYDVQLPSFDDVTGGLHFDQLDSANEATIRYACADSDFALRLYHTFNRWFMKFQPKHRYIVEEIESPTAVYCGLMRYNGALVDLSRMDNCRYVCEYQHSKLRYDLEYAVNLAYYNIELEEVLKRGEPIAQIDDFGNVSTPETHAARFTASGYCYADIGKTANTQSFKDFLFEALKLPVLKTTAKLTEAVDDSALIMLSEWCAEHRPDLVPLFKTIQDYRRWGKILSTYVDGYAKYINPVTGCIHADFMPLATETGRFACRQPKHANWAV